MNLYPINECLKTIMEQKLLRRGVVILQQFVCAQCGAKQTMTTPNTFFLKGQCEECGFITDLQVTGCNYAVIFSREKEE